MKKVFSLIISIIMICSCLPLTAYAEDAPVLRAVDIYSSNADLSWSYSGEYSGSIVEKSTDKQSWESVEDTMWDEAYVSLTEKKASYFRVRCYTDDGENRIYSAYSNVLELYPSLDDVLDSSDAYVEAYEKYSAAEWSIYKENKSSIDGFLIYKSVNGGEFNYAGSVSVSKPASKSDYLLRYKFKEKAPSKYGYLIKYLVCPYFSYNNKNYYTYDTSKAQKDSYIDYDNFATVKTGKKKIKIKIKALGGAPEYKIEYQRYNLKSDKYSKAKTVKTKSTSYSIKNNAAKYGCIFEITPYWKGEEGRSVYLDSHYGMALMEGAAKSKGKKIKIISTRQKKTKTVKSFKLSAKDKKIIKRFFKKHFKKKNATRAEKALFALEWINKKVKYDYDYKYGNLSYADAIFNKRYGQCLQYNGAFAEVLNYLGYESRIIEGYRINGRTGKPTVNHYWCEVKIHGRWYLCETGNYGKNGDWKYFCSRYENSSGYTKNGKPAKD